MKHIELDCIVCPMGCHIDVEIAQGKVVSVKGNTCIRGEKFAQSEVTCPQRMVTTTIRIYQGIHPCLPVITSQNVPKDKIFDIMKICKTLEVTAPIKAGDVLCKDIAHSGADLLASRSMEMRNSKDDQSILTTGDCGVEKL